MSLDLSTFEPIFNICKCLQTGQKIHAIKVARHAFEIDLKDAKDLIDAMYIVGGFDIAVEHAKIAQIISGHVMPKIARAAMLKLPAGSDEREAAEQMQDLLERNVKEKAGAL